MELTAVLHMLEVIHKNTFLSSEREWLRNGCTGTRCSRKLQHGSDRSACLFAGCSSSLSRNPQCIYSDIIISLAAKLATSSMEQSHSPASSGGHSRLLSQHVSGSLGGPGSRQIMQSEARNDCSICLNHDLAQCYLLPCKLRTRMAHAAHMHMGSMPSTHLCVRAVHADVRVCQV